MTCRWKVQRPLSPVGCWMLIPEHTKCSLSPSWGNGDCNSTPVKMNLVICLGTQIPSPPHTTRLHVPSCPKFRPYVFYVFLLYKKSAVSKTKSLWFENKWPALRFLKSQQSNKTKRGVWEHRELSVGFGNTMHFCLHFPGESRAMQVFTNAFTS